MAVRRENARLHSKDGKTVSLDALCGDLPTNNDVAREALNRITLHNLRTQFTDPKDRQIIDDYLAGYSLHQIAKHLGISPQAVQKRFAKIKSQISR